MGGGNSLFTVQSDKSVKQDILVSICGVTLTKLAVIYHCQWRSRVHPSPKMDFSPTHLIGLENYLVHSHWVDPGTVATVCSPS